MFALKFLSSFRHCSIRPSKIILSHKNTVITSRHQAIQLRNFSLSTVLKRSKNGKNDHKISRKLGKLLFYGVAGSILAGTVGGGTYYMINDDITKRQMRVTLEGGTRFMRLFE